VVVAGLGNVGYRVVRLLTELGYRFVRVVRKRRALYHLERDGFALEVCLDEVEGLARFAELGFPGPRDEEWRFTSLAPLLKVPFELAWDEDDAARDAYTAPEQVLGGREAMTRAAPSASRTRPTAQATRSRPQPR